MTVIGMYTLAGLERTTASILTVRREVKVSELLPIDLPSLLEQRLVQPRRKIEELYASAHLVGSLRHVMLDVAGAPKLKERVLTDYITMKTGDLWHDWMYATLDRSGWPYMREVKLSAWLPEGWRGRADLLVYHPEYQAFVLGDIKTTKGESMFWLDRYGAKEAHIWQVSAYWHACVKMGLPMLEAALVFYWPKNGVTDKEVAPSLQEVRPLPVKVLKEEMTYRWERTQEYLRSLPDEPASFEDYLTDDLEPVLERVQKRVKNSKGGFDVKLVPQAETRWCEFDTALCNCSEQGTTKIGEYQQDGTYVPRKGYEEIEPEV